MLEAVEVTPVEPKSRRSVRRTETLLQDGIEVRREEPFRGSEGVECGAAEVVDALRVVVELAVRIVAAAGERARAGGDDVLDITVSIY